MGELGGWKTIVEWEKPEKRKKGGGDKP